MRKVFAEGYRIDETALSRPESKLLKSGEARVSQPPTRRNRRRMFRRLRHCAVPGYSPICVDSNDPLTVHQAFAQRLMRNIPDPDPQILLEFRQFVRAYVREHIPIVTAYGFEEWLNTTTYTDERKADLRATFNELRGGRPNRKQCRKIASFIKSEFYQMYKHGRIINSRKDVFKVFAGPRFKAIEDAVYQLPEFIKHVPVPDRPALIAGMKQAGMKYFASDYTAFESHFTRQLMDACEFELYSHCLQNDNNGKFIMEVIGGLNIMSTRTGVTAMVTARRMSGEMCTSLGNGFTNLMLTKFVAHRKGGSVNGFVEGDDGLFSSTVELTAADYEKLGFTIKIEEVTDPTEASFCGMVFSSSGEIIREPRRFMQGFGWTQSFINAGDRIMDELLRAKALSTAYETPQCPIVGAFARYALRKTSHVHPRFVDDGYHNVLPDIKNVAAFHPSSDTRQLFEKLYGISISSQLAIEDAVERGDFSHVASLLPATSEQSDYTEKYVIVT